MTVIAPRDFAVAYSGGLDSTAVAYIYGKEYGGTMHLLTMDHKIGHLFPKLALRHVKDLRRIFGPERVIHEFLYTRQTFDHLYLHRWWADYREYRSHFVWCLACNLALDVHIIIHCLRHRVPSVLFCSSVGGQRYAVMSVPVTTRQRIDFYGEYGIRYRVPLLERGISKDEERKVLKDAGIWPGYRFRRAALGVQPLCLPGNFQHLPDTLFDIHPIYDDDQVKRFIMEKTPLMRKIIADHFRRQGEEIQPLVSAVGALRDAQAKEDREGSNPEGSLVPLNGKDHSGLDSL